MRVRLNGGAASARLCVVLRGDKPSRCSNQGKVAETVAAAEDGYRSMSAAWTISERACGTIVAVLALEVEGSWL